MKPHAREQAGFTILELLTVIVLIGLLAALLVPALSKAKEQAKRVQCLANLREVSLGLRLFKTDNGFYPWRLKVNEGGSRSLPDVADHFAVVASDLQSPRVLVCPSDVRRPAQDFASLLNTNVSYFLGIENMEEERPQMLIAGDVNVEGGGLKKDCLVADVKRVAVEFTAARIPRVYWSGSIHPRGGNVSLVDGSALKVHDYQLRDLLWNAGDDPRTFNNHILKP